MEKLIRQLRRELAANPKKTAFLGCGVLAAIYFWAPLVFGWSSQTESKRPKATSREASIAEATVDSAAGNERLLPGDWQDLARQLEEEPLRKLTALAAPKRDPFSRIAPGAVRQRSQQLGATEWAGGEQIVSPPAVQTPDLKLEAVLIHGQQRAAIINGALYREREHVGATVPQTGGAGPTVLEIHADHVNIGWGDETLRLELERAALAPGDRIVNHLQN